MVEAMPDEEIWALARAKAQFSALVRRAEERPQMLTRRGKPVAVLVSAKEWQKETERRGTLAEFLIASPLRGADLDVERLRDSSSGTHMRTTIDLDEGLLEHARSLTGVTGTTAIVRQALETLVRLESGKRLIALGGTMPDVEIPPRRRLE